MIMVNDAQLWWMMHNDNGRQTTAGNTQQQWTMHDDNTTQNNGWITHGQ
jgi:hypothetical protein